MGKKKQSLDSFPVCFSRHPYPITLSCLLYQADGQERSKWGFSLSSHSQNSKDGKLETLSSLI